MLIKESKGQALATFKPSYVHSAGGQEFTNLIAMANVSQPYLVKAIATIWIEEKSAWVYIVPRSIAQSCCLYKACPLTSS